MISSSAVTACMEKSKYFQAKVKSDFNVRKICLTHWKSPIAQQQCVVVSTSVNLVPSI